LTGGLPGRRAAGAHAHPRDSAASHALLSGVVLPRRIADAVAEHRDFLHGRRD